MLLRLPLVFLAASAPGNRHGHQLTVTFEVPIHGVAVGEGGGVLHGLVKTPFAEHSEVTGGGEVPGLETRDTPWRAAPWLRWDDGGLVQGPAFQPLANLLHQGCDVHGNDHSGRRGCLHHAGGDINTVLADTREKEKGIMTERQYTNMLPYSFDDTGALVIEPELFMSRPLSPDAYRQQSEWLLLFANNQGCVQSYPLL